MAIDKANLKRIYKRIESLKRKDVMTPEDKAMKDETLKLVQKMSIGAQYLVLEALKKAIDDQGGTLKINVDKDSVVYIPKPTIGNA